MSEPIRLDIGAGGCPLPGFTPIDIHDGKDARKLEYADNSVEEINASHILEHFSHEEAPRALAEWVRVLKPGGRMRIAVPDFAKCAKAYLDGEKLPIAGYIMGGQDDEHDFHKTLFDEDRLRHLMTAAGLTQIEPWEANGHASCASLPISLNLQGVKGGSSIQLRQPFPVHRKISAVMSVPRFGPTAHNNFVYKALGPLGIPMEMRWGAWWEHGLSEAMESLLRNNTEWVLTMDYDTAFSVEDIHALAVLMENHPEAAAIAPIQTKREEVTALFRPVDPVTGEYRTGTASLDEFEGDLTEVGWAHFGLTLIRTEWLRKMTRPWFLGIPNKVGRWDEFATHPDIYFWQNLRKAGGKLFVANHVAVGHMEWVSVWPRHDLSGSLFQYVSDYNRNGKPEGCRL